MLDSDNDLNEMIDINIDDDEDEIDLTEFVNGEGGEADEDINLDELLDEGEGDEEALEIDEYLVGDDGEEEEIELTPPVSAPAYQLDDDDEANNNDSSLYQLDDGDDVGEIVYDEDGKPIGKASRANAEQHAELTNLLSKKNI